MSKIIEYNRRQQRKRKSTLNTETHKTIKSLIITLSIMISVLLLVSFIISNENSQRGYTIEQEKLKNEHLKTINNNLTTKITQSTAFTEIEATENVEEMETNNDKIFITIEDNAIK